MSFETKTANCYLRFLNERLSRRNEKWTCRTVELNATLCFSRNSCIPFIVHFIVVFPANRNLCNQWQIRTILARGVHELDGVVGKTFRWPKWHNLHFHITNTVKQVFLKNSNKYEVWVSKTRRVISWGMSLEQTKHHCLQINWRKQLI